MLTLLTLGAHVQQGYGTQFVCVCVCLSVCLSVTDRQTHCGQFAGTKEDCVVCVH